MPVCVGVQPQGPQRALRSNSSGNSNAPGSASKLRVIIPQTTRIDGGCRVHDRIAYSPWVI
jgi:hypothetical protein